MPLGQRVAHVPPERRRSVPAPAQAPTRRRRSAAWAEAVEGAGAPMRLPLPKPGLESACRRAYSASRTCRQNGAFASAIRSVSFSSARRTFYRR